MAVEAERGDEPGDAPGRPCYDRERLYRLLWRSPHVGRRVVKERVLASTLGWHRSTVVRALAEMGSSGLLKPFRSAGRAGVLLHLTGDRPASP
jgi:hypothetical protein